MTGLYNRERLYPVVIVHHATGVLKRPKGETKVILNLTQHAATVDQIAAGVSDLAPETQARLRALLTFTTLPSAEEVDERAHQVAMLAEDAGDEADAVMVGGVPFFMGPLTRHLRAKGFRVLFAFSQRTSKEVSNPDGTVKKIQVFKHEGFVEAS